MRGKTRGETALARVKVFLIVILLTGVGFLLVCYLVGHYSRGPHIRFCYSWSNDLLETWINSSKVVYLEEMKEEKQLIPGGLGTTYSMKYFVMVVSGKLPLGNISIKAIHAKDEIRERAFIFPESFVNNDPVANIRTFEICALLPIKDEFHEGTLREMGLYYIKPGKYYIFLEQNGKKLFNGELLIKEGVSQKLQESHGKNKIASSLKSILGAFLRVFQKLRGKNKIASGSSESKVNLEEERARIKACKADVTSIVTAVQLYEIDHSTYDLGPILSYKDFVDKLVDGLKYDDTNADEILPDETNFTDFTYTGSETTFTIVVKARDSERTTVYGVLGRTYIRGGDVAKILSCEDDVRLMKKVLRLYEIDYSTYNLGPISSYEDFVDKLKGPDGIPYMSLHMSLPDTTNFTDFSYTGNDTTFMITVKAKDRKKTTVYGVPGRTYHW